jgi:hypothetical protein
VKRVTNEATRKNFPITTPKIGEQVMVSGAMSKVAEWWHF